MFRKTQKFCRLEKYFPHSFRLSNGRPPMVFNISNNFGFNKINRRENKGERAGGGVIFSYPEGKFNYLNCSLAEE